MAGLTDLKMLGNGSGRLPARPVSLSGFKLESYILVGYIYTIFKSVSGQRITGDIQCRYPEDHGGRMGDDSSTDHSSLGRHVLAYIIIYSQDAAPRGHLRPGLPFVALDGCTVCRLYHIHYHIS